MQRMWNLKCTIIPVIIGATRIVTKSVRKNMEAIPEKHSTDSLQKTAILGTSHIIRKVVQCESWSLSSGDHRWLKRSNRKKRSVTRVINNNINNNNNNMEYFLQIKYIFTTMFFYLLSFPNRHEAYTTRFCVQVLLKFCECKFLFVFIGFL